MKKNLLTEIKHTLQKKSAEVARGIEQTRQYLFTKTNHDLFEAAQGELDRETSAALASHSTALLGKIQVALQRLEDGSYGTCSQCGDTITIACKRCLGQYTAYPARKFVMTIRQV